MHDRQSTDHPISSRTIVASSRLFDLEEEVADLLAGINTVLSPSDAAEDEITSAQWQHGERTPLRGPATGFYLRLFSRCFPQQAREAFGKMDRTVEDYERMYADQINDRSALGPAPPSETLSSSEPLRIVQWRGPATAAPRSDSSVTSASWATTVLPHARNG